ncbi:MAG: hypothetical protein Q4A92_11605 [Corynebacterium sp.]|nr:hypothetical protein [Corynebacterium sp.]
MRNSVLIGCVAICALGLSACGGENSGETTSATESGVEKLDKSFVGSGEEVDAPEGFDPLNTGKVYGGSYSVTVTKAEELDTAYASVDGTAYFDLGDLSKVESDTEVNVHVRNGSISVILPKQAVVEIKCEAGSAEQGCEAKKFNDAVGGKVLTLVLDSPDGPVEVAELQE